MIREGFTLLETILVLAVFTVLVSVIVPSFMKQTVEAKIAKTKTGLEKLRAGIALYYAEKGKYPMGDMSQLLAPYLDEIPADGFENTNTITYSMGLTPCNFGGPYGGWCYAGDGHAGAITPNLPDNVQGYGFEKFSLY